MVVTTLNTDIRERVARIQVTPAIPLVLQPLLKMLAMPTEDVDIDEVVRLVSYDNTTAAQCLRVAGSPLFGLRQPPKSIAAAVVVLGLRRVESILLTCCIGQGLPVTKSALDATVFWKHSLGCAMVCRKFSEHLHDADREKAYVAGLLHDIGFLVNAMIAPNEFSAAFAKAAREHVPLHTAEAETMGFTHCESGQALAEQWGLAPEITRVIAHHHSVEECPTPRSLAAIVHLGDLMCRMRGLDYGYSENHRFDLLSNPAWTMLAEEHRELEGMDLELFAFGLDDAIAQVSEAVATILGKAATA